MTGIAGDFSCTSTEKRSVDMEFVLLNSKRPTSCWERSQYSHRDGNHVRYGTSSLVVNKNSGTLFFFFLKKLNLL